VNAPGECCTRCLHCAVVLVRNGAARVFVRTSPECGACVFPDPLSHNGAGAVHWQVSRFPWAVAEIVAEEAIARLLGTDG
jgi:hypothetical protein